MKKILISFFPILILISSVAFAETIRVKALESFSTQNPPVSYRVQALEPVNFAYEAYFETGTVIIGRVDKIQNPKRLKRDGYFEFTPLEYIAEGKIHKIGNLEYKAQIINYEPMEPKEVAISVAKKAAGFVVTGATQGISFVEGIKNAEEGQRIKSGLIKVYKDSPLSYIEVGEEINIKEGDILILKTKKIR